MKKLIYTIGILMFASAVLQPFEALGESDSQYSDAEPAVSKNRFFSDILPDFASENVFEDFGETDIDKVGVNLYAKILNMTIVNPEKTTTKSVAEKYGLTTAELDAVLSGSYLPLVERKPTLSQSELFLKVNEITKKFNEERDLASLEASIQAETMPSEIFMNGELGDSGFDLLYDLTMIEKLLFLKTSEYTIGADYNGSGGASGSSAGGSGGGSGGAGSVNGAGSGGGAVNSGGAYVGTPGVSDIGTGNASAPVGVLVPAGGLVPGPFVSVPSTESDLPKTESPASSEEPEQEQPVKGETFNPELCFADIGIKGLVNSFAQKNGLASPGFAGDNGPGSLLISSNPVNTGFGVQPGNTNVINSGQTLPPNNASSVAGNETGGSGGATGSSSGSSGVLVQGGSGNTDFLPANEPAPPKAVAAPRDNWKKEKVCDDVFCLFIDFYNDPPDSQYQDTDNCLACHVEKINDALRETINNSLMPNKMTGNLIEVPKCKSGMAASLTSLSMNLTVQFMPILTPLNDELILSSDSGVDWREYCEATAFLPAETCKEEKVPEYFEEEPESPEERIAQRELEMNSEATALEIAERISDAMLELENDAQDALVELNAKRASNANVVLFNSIKQEMDRMNLYFVSYRNIFRSLHEEVPGLVGIQACTQLKNKKVCK